MWAQRVVDSDCHPVSAVSITKLQEAVYAGFKRQMSTVVFHDMLSIYPLEKRQKAEGTCHTDGIGYL